MVHPQTERAEVGVEVVAQADLVASAGDTPGIATGFGVLVLIPRARHADRHVPVRVQVRQQAGIQYLLAAFAVAVFRGTEAAVVAVVIVVIGLGVGDAEAERGLLTEVVAKA